MWTRREATHLEGLGQREEGVCCCPKPKLQVPSMDCSVSINPLDEVMWSLGTPLK